MWGQGDTRTQMQTGWHRSWVQQDQGWRWGSARAASRPFWLPTSLRAGRRCFWWTVLREAKLLFSGHSSRLWTPGSNFHISSTASTHVSAPIVERRWVGVLIPAGLPQSEAGWASPGVKLCYLHSSLPWVGSAAWTRELQPKSSPLCCFPGQGSELWGTTRTWFASRSFMVTHGRGSASQQRPWGSDWQPGEAEMGPWVVGRDTRGYRGLWRNKCLQQGVKVPGFLPCNSEPSDFDSRDKRRGVRVVRQWGTAWWLVRQWLTTKLPKQRDRVGEHAVAWFISLLSNATCMELSVIHSLVSETKRSMKEPSEPSGTAHSQNILPTKQPKSSHFLSVDYPFISSFFLFFLPLLFNPLRSTVCVLGC